MIDVVARRRSYPSPLRYPGGKASLADFFESAIEALGLSRPTYVEPYAGGAGAGLELLYRGVVKRVVINDLDRSIYAVWTSMLDRTDDFLKRLEATPLTVDEWMRQREIYRARDEMDLDMLDLGFATFYLNRTNRSGVLRGGIIGGLEQAGTYKMDARFNEQPCGQGSSSWLRTARRSASATRTAWQGSSTGCRRKTCSRTSILRTTPRGASSI